MAAAAAESLAVPLPLDRQRGDGHELSPSRPNRLWGESKERVSMQHWHRNSRRARDTLGARRAARLSLGRGCHVVVDGGSHVARGGDVDVDVDRHGDETRRHARVSMVSTDGDGRTGRTYTPPAIITVFFSYDGRTYTPLLVHGLAHRTNRGVPVPPLWSELFRFCWIQA